MVLCFQHLQKCRPHRDAKVGIGPQVSARSCEKILDCSDGLVRERGFLREIRLSLTPFKVRSRSRVPAHAPGLYAPAPTLPKPHLPLISQSPVPERLLGEANIRRRQNKCDQGHGQDEHPGDCRAPRAREGHAAKACDRCCVVCGRSCRSRWVRLHTDGRPGKH